MQSLTFVSTAPVSGPLSGYTYQNLVSQKCGRPATSWGVSGGTCATISAAIALAASQKKPRKGRAARSTLCAFDPTKEVGAMAPLGYWDPLSLMYEESDPSKPFKDEETFRWYRQAELKHGRVSMLAMTGLIVGTFAKWPGFETVKSGFAALESPEGGAGMGIILLVAGIFELDILVQDPSKAPGDLGNPFLWDKSEESSIFTEEMRNRELAHCRLAMSAILVAAIYEYQGISPETFLKPDNDPAVAAGLAIVLGVLSQFKEEKDWVEMPKKLTAGGAPAITSESIAMKDSE